MSMLRYFSEIDEKPMSLTLRLFQILFCKILIQIFIQMLFFSIYSKFFFKIAKFDGNEA